MNHRRGGGKRPYIKEMTTSDNTPCVYQFKARNYPLMEEWELTRGNAMENSPYGASTTTLANGFSG